ncbi:MAG: hypothetical protein GEV28_37845 [Actinophytocola sp.]|uniref:DUF6882 domain-containing protein n=1 Tax=Actinophytocola sp. TaxID=1872138 RepID=UPI00132B5FDB|nr:DUF6882 domain-containing protein [Actinophytocola sp.]MPZ85836.1 hypothetical protein [Actinophytocola sp.]
MPTLTELLDDAALYSFEHQLHLADTLGEHSWYADFKAQTFEFTGAVNRRCTRFHVLGSAAPGPGSWLWSWANTVADYPAPILGLAEFVRDFGRQHGIPELAEPETAFQDFPGAPTEPHQVLSVITEAAKAVSNVWTSYNGEVGGGTRVAVLIDHPDFRLPPPEPARVQRVLQQSLTDLALTDHRRAFHSYAVRRGLGATFSADGTRLQIVGPGLDVAVRFNGQGLVVAMSSQLGQQA